MVRLFSGQVDGPDDSGRYHQRIGREHLDRQRRPAAQRSAGGRGNLPSRGRAQYRPDRQDHGPGDVYTTVVPAEEFPPGNEFAGIRYSRDDLLGVATGAVQPVVEKYDGPGHGKEIEIRPETVIPKSRISHRTA